jgi:hypothetical protein
MFDPSADGVCPPGGVARRRERRVTDRRLREQQAEGIRRPLQEVRQAEGVHRRRELRAVPGKPDEKAEAGLDRIGRDRRRVELFHSRDDEVPCGPACAHDPLRRSEGEIEHDQEMAARGGVDGRLARRGGRERLALIEDLEPGHLLELAVVVDLEVFRL